MESATFTESELKEFDELTLDLSSRDQLTRICARLEVSEFEKKHGKEKCRAMFAEIQRREKCGSDTATQEG